MVLAPLGPLLASSAKTAALELLAPAGLALGALIAPLVILYILKIKRERRVVASTWLWASAQRDLMAKSPFKRLIVQVPLIVQAVALALFALALARPATRGREITGDHVAIILDVSASMSAEVEGKTTRIDLAKRAAKDILASLAPGSDAILIEAGHDARLVAPLDRDRVRLAAAIDRVAARDVEGDLGAAVALAVDRLRQLGGSRRVMVITDGNLARPATLSGAAVPIEVVAVGAPIDNAAIVRVDVRSGSDPARGREEVQGFLVVANYGKAPRSLYITMRLANTTDVLASRREVVQPGERKAVQLGFHPAPGDYRKGLVFEISPHDAMPVDDIAYARVPAGDKLPVYLAGASPWIERAILADPMVDAKTGSVADLDAQRLDLDTFVVVERACPPSPPGGDLLIVHPPAGKCGGTLVGAEIDRPELTSWEHADPRMRFLTLDGVHITKANLLTPEGATQRLVNARQGTVIADASTATRTGTLIGFDVGESDWPLKASFVLFVRNLLEQARAHRARGVTGPARAGEPMRVTIPATATEIEATGPAGQKVDVSQRGGLAVVPDIAHVGFYALAWKGPQAGSIIVPANLTSALESDLTPRPIAVEAGSVTVTNVTEPDAHNEHTWLFALVALALVVFDVYWLTRDPRAAAKGASPAVAKPRMPERKTA